MLKEPIQTNPTLVTEEASQRELATTVFSPRVAKVLTVGFFIALAVPFAAQFASGQFGDFRALGPWPTQEKLEALTKSVGDASVLKQWVQPRLQEWLSGTGGFGNEKVTIGRDGWLYYAPGLAHLTGAPFLDPEHLRVKAKKKVYSSWKDVAQPDPRPAFRQLAADCQRLGIRLLVVPVPDKGAVVREPLGASGAVGNGDFARFREELTSYGAAVLPVEELVTAADAPWFLRQDTHWTPRFMDRVAQAIAARAREQVPAAPAPLYKLRRTTASSRGDLVEMLKLPEATALFGPETVEVDVVEEIGKPGPAEVLLMGDSFANIYSSTSVHWGTRAGLGEHIAFHLNAPVDVMAMNGGGALLLQELARAARTGRLAATRVIVWEFAERSLSLDDWPVAALGNVERQLLSRAAPVMPKSPALAEKNADAPVVAAASPAVVSAPAPAATVPSAPAGDTERMEVRATVVKMSRPVNPGTAPYEDALIYGKVTIDQVDAGKYGKKEAIVVFLAMKKRVLQAGAAHTVGQALRLRLVRMKRAPEEIRTMQRSDDMEDFDLEPYFVEEELP